MESDFLKIFYALIGLMMAIYLSGCVAGLKINTYKNMVFIPEGSFTMGFAIENDNEWGDMD